MNPPAGFHKAQSNDGTEIVGSIRGAGPPLVLLHAGLGDGEIDSAYVLPFLKEHFTCHLLSYRGRGRSGSPADRSPDRVVEDVAAYVESIGAPVGLVGPSGGARAALGAAARTRAVAALAVYEPIVLEILTDEEGEHFQAALAKMEQTAREGRLVEAARAWLEDFSNDAEMAAATATGYVEACAKYVPVLIQELHAISASGATSPTDPSVLRRIDASTLVLQGSETPEGWLREGVRHVADHLPHAHVRVVPGAAHMGHWFEPKAVASELIPFFQASLRGVGEEAAQRPMTGRLPRQR